MSQSGLAGKSGQAYCFHFSRLTLISKPNPNTYAGSQKLVCRKEEKSKGSPQQGLKTTSFATVNTDTKIKRVKKTI